MRTMNRYATSCLLIAAGLCWICSTRVDAAVIGQVSNIVPSTIRVSPNGKSVLVVAVDPKTKTRRVIVNGKPLEGVYDAIAKGTPFYSEDGNHYAFVATRGQKCMVVVDGVEQKSYDLIKGRWPITGLVFGSGGTQTHVAYQATRGNRTAVMVNGRDVGRYESVVTKTGSWPGIWDFEFVGDYFVYRAKHRHGMVACRGRIEGDRVRVETSKPYKSIGAGSPVSMGGKKGPKGLLFAFVAKDFPAKKPKKKTGAPEKPEPGKEFLRQLPGDEKISNKPWKYIARNTLYPSRAKPGEMVYVGGDTAWHVCVGPKEWPACQRMGRLMSSESGKTWGCTAKMDGKFVMMINGVPSKAYLQIQTGESLFPAGDERAIYGVAILGESKTPARIVVGQKELKAYPQVRGDSVVFSADKKIMAYVAGDGKKNFVVVNGVEGPAFDNVSDLVFAPKGSGFAYCALQGMEHFVVINGKKMGPYDNVKTGSLVFSPDGKSAAYAAFGADATWKVYVNGKTSEPGCDAVISQITFTPGASAPAYVGRYIAGGKTSFALSFHGKLSRKYGAIWMGDGGTLFVNEAGNIEYFAKSRTLLYRVVTQAK